jgi:hypothetical protein
MEQMTAEEASRGKKKGKCIVALYLSSQCCGEQKLDYLKAPTTPAEEGSSYMTFHGE